MEDTLRRWSISRGNRSYAFRQAYMSRSLLLLLRVAIRICTVNQTQFDVVPSFHIGFTRNAMSLLIKYFTKRFHITRSCEHNTRHDVEAHSIYKKFTYRNYKIFTCEQFSSRQHVSLNAGDAKKIRRSRLGYHENPTMPNPKHYPWPLLVSQCPQELLTT